MIIDFHTHIFPPWLRDNRQDYLGDPCFAGLYDSPKAKMATSEEIMEHMDQNGVDISVVCNIGWTSQELCNRTNDYILEAVARYPDRLVGLCAVCPGAGEAAVRELERCAKGGAGGLGEMRPDVQGFDPGDMNVMGPLVEVMQKNRLIFLTHTSEPVGHLYPGKGGVTPDMIYRLIVKFPELRVVCGHWGGGLPFYALMPEVGRALANTYFDTAATPFLYKPEIFKYVADILGADKILLGSDYPLMSPKRVIAQVETLELFPEINDMILGGNAQRLLEWNKSAVSLP